jgi:hypothetical protein
VIGEPAIFRPLETKGFSLGSLMVGDASKCFRASNHQTIQSRSPACSTVPESGLET